MATNKDLSGLREYIAELETIRSEVNHVLEKGSKKGISSAAKYYPGKLNHLLTGRNIKSISGFPPFFDLAFMEKRKQDIVLLDLNASKDGIDILNDVIRRIDRELDEL